MNLFNRVIREIKSSAAFAITATVLTTLPKTKTNPYEAWQHNHTQLSIKDNRFTKFKAKPYPIPKHLIIGNKQARHQDRGALFYLFIVFTIAIFLGVIYSVVAG